MKKQKCNKKQCGTVRINAAVPIIGIICSLFFGIILIISICDNGAFFTNCVLGVLLLFGVLMILTLNQKINYTPNGFSYRDMFRITHRYEYSQVQKISYGKDSWLKVGHRIIFIDQMTVNGRKFVRIAMQYSQNAEIKTEARSKLFNGNIKSPGEFIFIWVIFYLVIIGFMIWGINFTKPTKVDELYPYSGTIESCKFDAENQDGHKRLIIKFNSCPDIFYTWELDEDTPEYADLSRDVSENKVFDIYFSKKEKAADMTEIYMMSAEDKMYISLDARNSEAKKIRAVFIGFSAFFLIAMTVFIIISVHVMSNAEKYPRAIKWFVKPSYIIKKPKK